MKKPQILIVNGVARSGKDTFAKFLSDHANVEKLSVITLAKEIALMAGWDGYKNDRSRRFLMEIKDLIDEFNDGTFFYVKSAVLDIVNNKQCDYILIDAREMKDIQRLIKEFGEYNCLSVYVENKNVVTYPKNRADIASYNSSDKYDIILDNNGSLYDFKRNVAELHLKLSNK